MKPRCLLTVLVLAYDASAALLGDRISYLAYGSNLHPAVFERRRGIKPLAMSPAVAPGWRLAFDLRGGGAEPSFASARPDARRELYGALYDLTPSDWARVCASEGVPFGYVVCPVRCRKLDDDEIEWAFTLAAAPPRQTREAPPHPRRACRRSPRARPRAGAAVTRLDIHSSKLLLSIIFSTVAAPRFLL